MSSAFSRRFFGWFLIIFYLYYHWFIFILCMIMSDILLQLNNAVTKKRLQERYGIDHLRIFWSQVKGNAHNTSDIDLLYTYTPWSDPLSFVDARQYLKRKLKKKVDLVHVDVLDKSIKSEVLSHRVSVW
jgi:predicted nucleotidyltransferase